jgi:hypothetical protein
MRMSFLIAGAAALVMSQLPAMAQSVPSGDPQFGVTDQQLPSVDPKFASATDPGNKVLCKTVARSGSRFGERKCQTVAQWDAISEAAHRGAEDAFNKPGFFDCRSAGNVSGGGSMAGAPGGGMGC